MKETRNESNLEGGIIEEKGSGIQMVTHKRSFDHVKDTIQLDWKTTK